MPITINELKIPRIVPLWTERQINAINRQNLTSHCVLSQVEVTSQLVTISFQNAPRHIVYNRVIHQLMTDSLEKFGDIVSGTLGPLPGKSIIVQHAGHYVVHTRTISETSAFGVVVVRHVKSVMHFGYFLWVECFKKS